MDDVLERVRMCVAEAGYDPNRVHMESYGPSITHTIFNDPANNIPMEVVWRAFSIGANCTACLACFLARRGNADCLAPARLAEDCGVSRG